jgi:hypothetical protein
MLINVNYIYNIYKAKKKRVQVVPIARVCLGIHSDHGAHRPDG